MKRDLRAYVRQTNTQLIVGGILILFIVGDGLIYLIYGPGAAVMGLLCLGGGLIPIGLIIFIFWGMDWIVRRANRQ
jgi:hypothetical protein